MTREEIEKMAEEIYREYPSNPIEHAEWTYNKDIHCHKKRRAFVRGFLACQQQQSDAVDKAYKKGFEDGESAEFWKNRNSSSYDSGD